MANSGAAASLASQYGGDVKLTGRNEDETALLGATRRLFEDIQERGGVDPASFLNMHPWDIYSTGPLQAGIVIPMCPIGQPYLQFVQKDIRVDRAETPGGIFIPSAVWPIILMRDAMRQHETWGGMVVYMGDLRLGAGKSKVANSRMLLETLLSRTKDEDTRLLIEQLAAQQQAEPDARYASERDVMRMIADAEGKQVQYYKRRCTLVDGIYAGDKGKAYMSISSQDRQMARWLHHRGIHASLKPWVTEERADDYKPKKCAKCGTDCDPAFYSCQKCGRVHDGIKAYLDGDIDISNIALKRHTREELDKAGLQGVETIAEMRDKAAATETKEVAAKKAKAGA